MGISEISRCFTIVVHYYAKYLVIKYYSWISFANYEHSSICMGYIYALQKAYEKGRFKNSNFGIFMK